MQYKPGPIEIQPNTLYDLILYFLLVILIIMMLLHSALYAMIVINSNIMSKLA